MSAEYSVRKNAFTADGGTHKVARILDVADGLRRIGEFESAEMLRAYAERIKAGEGAVTDEVVEIAAETHMRVRGLGMHAPWQTMTEETRISYRKAMRAALLAVWPNPPAQAAQVDVIGHPRGPDEQRDEIELYLRDAYAAGCHATQSRSMVTAVEYAHREAPKLRAIVKPTAEPVAQGEARCQYCDGTGDVHGIDGEWRGSCTECPAAMEREFKNFHRQLCERFGYTHDEKDWRRDQVSLIEFIAAQPRAVPDGMGEAVLVPRETLLAIVSALDVATGDSDPNIDPDMTDDEVRDEYPEVWAMRQLSGLITTSPAQPRAVPDGWALGPREPTDAMCDAGDLPDTATAYDIYKAMIAAAPSPGESA